jgi:CRP-like cAMP-binding protein
MLAAAHDPHPLIRQLQTIFSLSEEERQAVRDLQMTVRDFKADQDIVREQDQPFQCCLVVDGLVCRYKITAKGRRQILSFHIPGDIPDLQSLRLESMDHSLATLAPAKLGFIDHDVMNNLIRAYPRIGDALWRDTLVDASRFREWELNLGQRDASAKLAHVFCEMFLRMKAVGRTRAHSYTFPVTQEELGAATGISTVHVNRTMQELRDKGLIRTATHEIIIEDWEGLQEAGEFDPHYLHLKNQGLEKQLA